MTHLASQSSSVAALLPPLSALQTWVHRPQAVTKCNVSDVYALQALVANTPSQLNSRDIFLLNQYPCKMVELVGWVAGVEDKESVMNITLDDGDGSAVLPIRYCLPRVAASAQSTQRSPIKSRTNFLSKAERQAVAAAAAKAEFENTFSKKAPVKVYERKDIRVGDVVRIVGKVDEYARRKETGLEWVRGVTIEEGAGGKIEVVDADVQYLHVAEVTDLHQTMYCRPFEIPVLTTPPSHLCPTTIWQESLNSVSQNSDDMDNQSELLSELTIGDDGALPDIRKLRSSQLHDTTFRRYLLDHMTEEVRVAALNADLVGQSEVERALHRLFPEYKLSSKAKSRNILTSAQSPNIATGPYSTPRNFLSKAERIALIQPLTPYPVFTISSLVATPHLSELAGMITDSEVKKSERRRRRRIRDGEATEKDRQIEEAAKWNATGKVEWRMTGEKKQRAMERLVNWGLRSISEEGSLVHVQPEPAGNGNLQTPAYLRTPTTASSAASTSKNLDTTAYITLPPPLLLPLLLRQLEAEKEIRSRQFMSRSDPRWRSGMTLAELTYKMRGWGEEGRWERLGEWRVEEAVQWGLIRGLIRREGQGFWAVDRDNWVG